jgi:hypothetical protein
MKTKLFGSFDINDEQNKDFIDDFKSLLIIDKECIKIIIEKSVDLMSVKQKTVYLKSIDELNTKIGISQSSLLRYVSLFQFLLEQLSEPEYKSDSISNLADDILSTNKFDQSSSDKIIYIFTLLRKKIEKGADEIILKNMTARGALPCIKNIRSTIELRAIIENGYKVGTKSSAYTPIVKGIVPIASIGIDTDIDTQSSFFFQATSEDVDVLIDKLSAIKKEFEALLKFNNK